MDGSHVAWIFELIVNDGHDAALGTLMTEMVDATRADEPGTLDYEWYLSEDGRRLHIYERYADAAATLAHLGNFRERYLTRFFTALTPERMVLYGAPDAAVRSALAQLAPPVMPQVGGFTRHAPAGKTGTR